MENNLVELKYDRINEYFENFKQKYTNNYEKNKTKGYRTVIPYHMLIDPTIMSVISVIAVYVTNTMLSDLPKTNSNDMSGAVYRMYEVVSSWIMPVIVLVSLSHLLVTFIRMMSNCYETPISYKKIDYYNKIKSRMLNEIQTDFNTLITENMLIFDTNGLIVAPNLSTNENKKIFGEIERELKMSGKQFSKAQS